MNDILSFAGALIEESGGAVEWNPSENSFQALLSDDTYHRLGLPESFVTISDTTSEGESEGIIPVGYGTELLDRAILMAKELGGTASVRMPAPSIRKQAGPDPAHSFGFLNSTFEIKGTYDSWLDYWVWTFDVAADADERHEAILHTCVSSLGAGSPGLPELIFQHALNWEPLTVKESEFKEQLLDKLFVVACDRVVRQAGESLSQFKETVTRHHARDIRRIETYFQDLNREMKAEIQKRQLKGAELDIRKEKMQQLQGEKDRKLNALKDKYRLRLTINPTAVLLARIPIKRCDLLVKRRKGERRISVIYNSLSKEFDPMACEACGHDTFILGFCDANLHILCESCLAMFTNQKTCPRCRGNRPPTEVETVLARLGMAKGAEKSS